MLGTCTSLCIVYQEVVRFGAILFKFLGFLLASIDQCFSLGGLVEGSLFCDWRLRSVSLLKTSLVILNYANGNHQRYWSKSGHYDW